MKYLFLLFLICAVQTALSRIYRGPPTFTDSPVLLGSVRDLNSGLPKCIGTFVTSDTLVTTARCLLCNNNNCNLTVFTTYPNVLMTVKYKIKSIKIHQTFKMDPRRNDIGLVRLEEKVPDSAVAELPNKKIYLTKLWAYAFTGRVLFRKYYFEAKKVKVISSARCTFALHKYVPQSQVCAYTIRKHYFRNQDQGSPLIYFQRGKMYLLGRYVVDNFRIRQGMRIAVYQAIFSHIKWINMNAKNKTDDSKCVTVKPTAPIWTPDLNITSEVIGTTQKHPETTNVPAAATITEAAEATNTSTAAATTTTTITRTPSTTTVDS